MRRGRQKQSRREEPPGRPRERETSDIARLREENERLRRLLEEYARRIADLERQLALKQQNSTLASKPPSSDGLAGQQRPRGRRRKGRRTPGGQRGHPGHHRPLVPLDRVDAVVDLAAEACRHCARRLHTRHTVGEPRRHQVTELPPIAAHITEYRCQRRQCPDCGTITLAPLPDDGATQFGPQLTALIAYLTVVCRMPRLVVQRFLAGALQIPISLGSTQAAWEETSAAVAPSYAALAAALAHERVINADETGHRTNGDKRWLWTFVARTFVLYRIATSEQGERAVERLLTIVRTCQLQQLNALAYLTAAVTAHRRGHPVASLLKRRQTP
jgi:transposase